ncbi:hypothetical protein DL764_000175 [Monosporascus ibericus]|uniref:Uncharacterized protein n=1 Tax=Monosporascus ibericus TaxID=155417 RepID=A0A4V1XCX0_9PEZI|nr:hypothetical protein DL764_000175 [Monosporascus ibericus]
MVNVALGYSVGDWVAENLGIIRPFQLAPVSVSVSCLYCLLCIPYIDPNTISRKKREIESKGATAFLGPLRSMAPQRLRLQDVLLMAVNGLIHGVFLMFIFPQIIWFRTSSEPVVLQPSPESPIPTHPQDFDPVPATVAGAEPMIPPDPVAEVEGGAFGSFFLRWSLVLDGLVIALAAFATRGWHIYLGKLRSGE